MYFISNIFLRIRGVSKSSCTNAIFFALVQELIDRPSYINEQLLEHDAYISCLQLKKVNVAHDAMHNNYLYNHTAYYHVLQQVIAFLVYSEIGVYTVYIIFVFLLLNIADRGYSLAKIRKTSQFFMHGHVCVMIYV